MSTTEQAAIMSDVKIGDEIKFQGQARKVIKLLSITVALEGVDDAICLPIEATMVSVFKNTDPVSVKQQTDQLWKQAEYYDALSDEARRRGHISHSIKFAEAAEWTRVEAREIESGEPCRDPVDLARARGVAARTAGCQRKAIPPEFRTLDRRAEADAWFAGWDQDYDFSL